MSAAVVRAERTRAPGLRSQVSSAPLGGTTSIREGLVAPGELIPRHTHSREDQCVYVVSGVLRLEIGTEVVEAPAGSYVIEPRGLSHAFWNPGSTPALVMEITSPGGFELMNRGRRLSTG